MLVDFWFPPQPEADWGGVGRGQIKNRQVVANGSRLLR